MYKPDFHITQKPLMTNSECGDIGIIKEYDHKLFVCAIDVLGHGKEAYEVAIQCRDFLDINYKKNLPEIIRELHEHIKGSRGAVAALCLLDLENGMLEYAGIGNITIKRFRSGKNKVYKTLHTRSGIIGYIIPTPRKEAIKLFLGDLLVLFSDGVREHFEMQDYPDILTDNAETVAKNIISRFGKKTDDAICIAIKIREQKNA